MRWREFSLRGVAQEKLHFCFDLIKAKYWAIVRRSAGSVDTVIISRGAFVLKAALMRETNSGVEGASFFFFLVL